VSGKKKDSMRKAPGNQGTHEKKLAPSKVAPSRGGLQKGTSTIAFIPLLIILLVSFAVYFNALSWDFVYDDKDQVVENPWIRDIGNILTIFSKGVWSFKLEGNTSNYYRPLMHIVYMLNYHLFGLNPWGFHLVNILFHCGASVLVFLIIRRFLTEQRGTTPSTYLSPPFIAAVLFASHPIHTEAVTWIAGLPDVAFTVFYLLAFYFYMLFRDGAKGCYAASVLSFSVATLFKEPALTLPIVLIIYDYQLRKFDETLRVEIKRYIPYVVVSAIYLSLRYYALGSFAPTESYASLSTYQFIINVFPLFREYLTSLLWPFNPNFWHTFHPISSLFDAKGMSSIVVTTIFVVVAVAARNRNKMLFWGLLLLVIPLLPVFYIKGITGKPFAERYLYLPSFGYVLLVAVFLSWAKETLPHSVMIISIVATIIVGAYAVGTINRNNAWKDNFALWSDTARKSPDSANAHYNLGVEYISLRQSDRAMAEFQAAVRLKPDASEAHNDLGFAYASEGQWERAIAEYQTAVRLKPDNAKAHNNLGVAYASQGQADRAATEYQTAVRLKPDFVKAYYNLANVYASQGQMEKAVAEYQTVLRLKPDYAEAHNNLGTAYASQGQMDRATEEYETALRLRPDNAKAHNNLGTVYRSQGQMDRAVAEYETALRLRPDYAEAHYNLAIAYGLQSHLDKAAAEYQTTLRLKPDFRDARQRLNDIVSRQH